MPRYARRKGASTGRFLSSALVFLLVCGTVAAIAEPALAQSASDITIAFTLYSPSASAPCGTAAVAAKNSTALAWRSEQAVSPLSAHAHACGGDLSSRHGHVFRFPRKPAP